MSEKGFYYEFGNDGYYIIDKEKIEEYDESFTDKMEYREYTIENSLSGDEVVDLLNSQSKLICAYMYEFSKMNKENKKLKEENEQLRKLLREAEDEIETLKKSNQSFMESLVNKESEDEDDIYVPSKSSMRFL